jgi:hypothetical protein
LLVQLEGDQQRGRDQGHVLGPKLVEPEPDSFDQLESAVSERDDSQLVCAQAMASAASISILANTSSIESSLGEPAEVGGEMDDQIGAGGEQ